MEAGRRRNNRKLYSLKKIFVFVFSVSSFKHFSFYLLFDSVSDSDINRGAFFFKLKEELIISQPSFTITTAGCEQMCEDK